MTCICLLFFSGYNMPRFWEVDVYRKEECEASMNSSNNSISLITCYNVTDVVKTSLRRDSDYIAVRMHYLIYSSGLQTIQYTIC